MRRYQTASQRASGESSGSASAWVRAGSSNLRCVLARPGRPAAGPKESAAKMATRSTAEPGRPGDPPGARAAPRSARAAAIAPAHAGVASYAMPGVEFYTAAVPTEDWIAAGVWVAGRVHRGRGRRPAAGRARQALSTAVAGGELSAAATTRLRLIRRLIFAAIIVDRGRDRPHPDPRGAQHRHGGARLLGGARPGGRLRRAPDAGQRHRRDPARDHPADPHRRPRDLRGGDRRGRGREAHLHLHPPRRRAPADRPQRAAGPELDREPHDRRPARAGGGVGLARRPTPTSTARSS